MTFTEKVKAEILNTKLSQPCCQVSALSAFVRGAGTLVSKKGYFGFEVVTENLSALEYFAGIVSNVFGIKPAITKRKDNLSGREKYRMSVISKESFSLLIELGILKADERGAEVNLLIDRYLLENDCCKTAYLLGAFIGAGSVTIPNGKTTTSYHLEFVFSNYATAQDFSALLSELGFLPKLTKRKDSHIVYFKNGDDIADVLFTLGATKCGFEVKDIVVKKTMNNDINRRFNCDMSNINKQIEASIKQVKDITLIEETIGLDSLSPTLKSTAKLRLENRSATLEEMAKISGLTKSCLNHRLRKIAEIARNL